MTRRKKTLEERCQNAQEQLDRWKKPIDSLESWDHYQHLEDLIEGKHEDH